MKQTIKRIIVIFNIIFNNLYLAHKWTVITDILFTNKNTMLEYLVHTAIINGYTL